MILTEQESIFCQAIAMTSLLVELHNTDFLNSDYYKNNVSFEGNNNNIKIILKESGLGNPAIMQMFLYILLVMPKEMLSCVDESTINTWAKELKYSILSCNPDVTTTYPKENQNDLTSIDYYRHIRNAVSHSKCVYKNENNRAYGFFFTLYRCFVHNLCHLFANGTDVTPSDSNIAHLSGDWWSTGNVYGARHH